MRNALLALTLSCLFLSAYAADGGRPTFINAKVSAKQICINEPVRLEFTTMPRDVEGVDIAASVTNSLRLGAATTWRLLGEPVVSEALRGMAPTSDEKVKERPKPVTVTVSLLPRTTGDLQLPDIPITWLQGNTVARFSIVTVQPNVMIVGTPRDLPREVHGVGGFAWSSTLDEVKTRVDASKIKKDGNKTIITPQEHLTLTFTAGMFAEATLRAPGLTIEQARNSFLQRWGVPHAESKDFLDWHLGWTTIIALPDGQGITLKLIREDVTAQMARLQVSTDVFGVLDGPQETAAQADERREREIEREANRPPAPEAPQQ